MYNMCDNPALLLNMIKLNQSVHIIEMILTFSLLEMHTDKSTNCTLLGPVDCDSFYKWIPLNRWPVAISSEVLHFIYCAFPFKSLSNTCSSHHSLFIPPST